MKDRQKVAFEPHHQHLAFRIAEADIVFDEFRPLGGDHQAGKEDALKGYPLSAMPRIVGSMISFIVRSTISGVITGAGE